MENIVAQAEKVDELKQLIFKDATISSDLMAISDYLPACEYELISFMVAQSAWKGNQPPPPAGYTPGAGSVDFGLFLYWLNNPGLLDLSYFSFLEKIEIKALIQLLDDLHLIAPTQMTSENYDYLESSELIYSDGSVLSIKPYATYDQGWFIAFLNLAETVIRDLWYSGDSFPAIPPPTIPLVGTETNTVSIAILGDWGTGGATSESVMNSITTTVKPDYIIHVGDVYYAGTPLSTGPNGSHYFGAGEEQENLLDSWPSSYIGRSFTLNSNHEMYSGANGYFNEALNASNHGSGTPFSAQKGSSCFALQYGGWTILGLDSAYMASSIDAFMTGSIGGADGAQGQWIKSLGLTPENTIVLTHHNGFAFDCSSVSSLWGEINGALNGDPYAWYWGHVHNGIVYDAPITIPSTPDQTGLSTNTFSRCLGHGALPYGPSSELDGKPIAWRATNLSGSSLQLANGYAVLTLTTNAANQLTGITESFYDISTNSAVWTKQIY